MTPEELKQRLSESIVAPDLSISEALAQIEKAGTGALLLSGEDGCLSGLVTDGDIRRAILQGKSLDDPCESIACRHPVTARAPVSPGEALHVMNHHDINQLPVLDADGRIQLFLLRKDLVVETDAPAEVERRLKESCVPPGASISEAMKRLDQAGTGALLVCDSDKRLLGVLTDGDIRRAILQRRSLDSPCESIASRQPITAKAPVSLAEALCVMNDHDISHLPVLDADGRVQMLLLRRDVATESDLGLSAVIMAGGYGTRLRPLTEKLPKPMLTVGDRPLLELTIAQLKRAGIKDVSLATHYLPESISRHFGNGESFGVRLEYLHEVHPLGTAGGLKLLKNVAGTMLVINGDILTGAPFPAMLAFHRQYHADLTVGVRKYEIEIPFGVVECDEVRVTRLQEKPSLGFFINAGTYLIEPSMCGYIPDGRRFDMTDLIQKLIEAGRTVVSFPIVEYWLDIGRHADYQQAQEDVRSRRIH